MTDEKQDIPEEKQEDIEIHIVLGADGSFTMRGPISNPMMFYYLLNLARTRMDFIMARKYAAADMAAAEAARQGKIVSPQEVTKARHGIFKGRRRGQR